MLDDGQLVTGPLAQDFVRRRVHRQLREVTLARGKGRPQRRHLLLQRLELRAQLVELGARARVHRLDRQAVRAQLARRARLRRGSCALQCLVVTAKLPDGLPVAPSLLAVQLFEFAELGIARRECALQLTAERTH